MHAKKGVNDALSVEKKPRKSTGSVEAYNATGVSIVGTIFNQNDDRKQNNARCTSAMFGSGRI